MVGLLGLAGLGAAVSSCAGEEASGPPVTGIAAEGQQLFKSNGCAACHSVDGSDGVGPTMQGLLGSQVELQSGATVTADEAYIRNSIVNPGAERVAGYNAAMPARDLSATELEALVAYISALR
jgi:cytochrome c oxidase subunit 2